MTPEQIANNRMLTGCLRTNRFRQIPNLLSVHNTNQRCVQGVAMDLGGNLYNESGSPAPDWAATMNFYGWASTDPYYQSLNLAEYGMPENRDGSSRGIIELNNSGVTFPQLADLIDYFALGEPCRTEPCPLEQLELLEATC